MKHYKSVEFNEISECQAPLNRRRAPYWKLFRDGSVGKGSSTTVEGNGNLFKKIVTLCLFLFINNVDLKNNNRNYRKHTEFSGCPNSCNKFVSIRPW